MGPHTLPHQQSPAWGLLEDGGDKDNEGIKEGIGGKCKIVSKEKWGRKNGRRRSKMNCESSSVCPSSLVMPSLRISLARLSGCSRVSLQSLLEIWDQFSFDSFNKTPLLQKVKWISLSRNG